jgi:hypothetical protein
MSVTNFPYGFIGSLTLKGLPLLQTHPGNIYWVDNGPPTLATTAPSASGTIRTTGGSDQNPGTFQRPFATIAQAMSVCSQNNGDIILVKPGHIEICTTAPSTTGVANMAPVYDPTGTIVVSNGGTAGYNFQLNKSDVAIIGLGIGNSRPQIVFSTATTATINVSGTNISMQNFLFTGNFAAVASAFTMIDASIATGIITGNVLATGAITRVLWPGATLVPTAANGIIPGTVVLNQLTGVTGALGTYTVSVTYSVATTSATVIAGPTDFNLENCEVRDVGTALNLITLVTTGAGAGGSDGLRIANTQWNSLATAASAAGNLITLGGAVDRLTVTDNRVYATATSTGALLVVAGANNVTNATIARNVGYKPTTAATGLLVTSSSTASSGIMYDNYGWSLATSAGLLVSTGTKLGFANNYATITGTADKQAIINPGQA